MKATGEVRMNTAVKLAGTVLALAIACTAQDGLSVRNRGKQNWPRTEAEKIYLSACSVVQREFGSNRALEPQVTLVLGAEKNEVWFPGKEIRLTEWNLDRFAQGVVWLAFLELMPSQQRLTIAKRAVNWADSTVEIRQLKK